MDPVLAPASVYTIVVATDLGKSTLVKIAAGIERTDEAGEILVAGRPPESVSPRTSFPVGLRFLHEDLALIEASSVADNIPLTGGLPTRAGTIGCTSESWRGAGSALSCLGTMAEPPNAWCAAQERC